MPMIALLTFVGIFLIAIEGVTPHGISGFIGFAVVILSGYLAIRTAGMATGILYCILSLAVSIFAMYLAYQHGLRLMALEGEKPPPPAETIGAPEEGEPAPVAGDPARVVKPLRPTGEIEWNGRRLPARSIQPELELAVGERVRVRGQDSIFYLVEPDEDASTLPSA